MKDNVEDVASWLEALTPSRRAQFLSVLSHQLTVGIRVLCYDAETIPSMLNSVRALNEVHHRVAGYLVYLTANEEDTGWLKSLAGYLVLCSDVNAKKHIEHAWTHAETINGTAA